MRDFLKALLKADLFNQLENHFKDTPKWASLDNAYVNFTHWIPVKGNHDSIPYQKNGLFVSWLRQIAYICQRNFPAIDLSMPMAFRRPDGTVNPECMSGIFISVKNCIETEDIGWDYLPQGAVEGVVSKTKRKADSEADVEAKTLKADDGGRHVRQEPVVEDKVDGEESKKVEKDIAKPKISPYSKHLNVRLTLHSLKFLNPEGIPDKGSPSNSWMGPTQDKPYVAFAMRMGMTDREQNLFVAEKNVNSCPGLTNLKESYNSHRIAFALRGFTNTYDFRDEGVERSLKDINIRHDLSGDYPQSAMDFRAEKGATLEARKPLDDLYGCLSKLSLEDVDEEIVEDGDEYMEID